MSESFSSLGVSAEVEHALDARGITAPFRIQTLVIPDCGHHPAEETPEETLAALTAFLAPYRDAPAAAHHPGP